MISANELRANNIVGVEPSMLSPTGYHRIIPQDIADLAEGRIAPDTFKPVPLSPALLERSGFVKDGDQWHKQYREGRRAFSLTYDGEVFTYQVSHAETLTVWDLHQLQNLFFALTGEELQYTP